MKDSTINIIKVVGANATALSTTFTDINAALTSLSLILASTYTIYKFLKEISSKKDV